MEQVVVNPGPYQELRDQVKVPPNLCATCERPDMEEAVIHQWSQFAMGEEKEEDEEDEEQQHEMAQA